MILLNIFHTFHTCMCWFDLVKFQEHPDYLKSREVTELYILRFFNLYLGSQLRYGDSKAFSYYRLFCVGFEHKQ